MNQNLNSKIYLKYAFSSYCSFNFSYYRPNSLIHRFPHEVRKIAILTPVGALPFSASLFYSQGPGDIEKWCASPDRVNYSKFLLYFV